MQEYQNAVLKCSAVGSCAWTKYVEKPRSERSVRKGMIDSAIATRPKSAGASNRARITTVSSPLSLLNHFCAVIQRTLPAAVLENFCWSSDVTFRSLGTAAQLPVSIFVPRQLRPFSRKGDGVSSSPNLGALGTDMKKRRRG